MVGVAVQRSRAQMAESSSKCSCNEQQRQLCCFRRADRPVWTLLIQLLLIRAVAPVSRAYFDGLCHQHLMQQLNLCLETAR